MGGLIQAAIERSRAVLLIFVLILVAGGLTLNSIPKENNPDVPIPIIYISIPHEGISPEDSERMLLRPMEKELKSLEGIKRMNSVASEGHASITLEFFPEVDATEALADVRDKVTLAKAKLPSGGEEPTIHEVSMADESPAITVSLSGDAPEYALSMAARNLRDKLEGFSEVMEVKINGMREDLLEVVVDPQLMESYDITPTELFSLVSNNNQLVAAGTLDTGAGRYAIKVPGLIKDLGEMLSVPVKVIDDKVITFRDIATIRRTYKDPRSFARLDGKPALTLEVIKRPGENTIETVDKVRLAVTEAHQSWPIDIKVTFTGDEAVEVKRMFDDLSNNVLSAIILVTIVIVATLGLHSAGLVGIAIPGAFLAGIMVLSLTGVTMNMVVLFALIMAVGMLVDGAIVVTEYADRKMSEGNDRKSAYSEAARRMALPITASTITTLAAFAPLLFWPDIMGEFMKYLPMTLIAVLSASLIMALVFVPTLGGVFGKPRFISQQEKNNLKHTETGDLSKVTGFTGRYVSMIRYCINHAGLTVFVSVLMLFGAIIGFSLFGKGIEFFPATEPPATTVIVKARGDLSIHEKDAIVREVESRLAGFESDIKTQRVTVAGDNTIGRIRLGFKDWDQRRPAKEIYEEINQRIEGISGIEVSIRQDQNGPGGGKPFQLQVTSQFPDAVNKTIETISAAMKADADFIDIDDDRSSPGIEWRLEVDREQAARYGASVTSLGSMVQLVTNGIKVAEYRPDDAEEEVDIRVRYPTEMRHLEQLDKLRVNTSYGLVPIGNFVERIPAPKVTSIKRVDGRRSNWLTADLKPGVNFNQKLQQIQQILPTLDIDPRVELAFKGQNEEQAKSQDFLINAFMIAAAIIFIVLVAQFNSFYQAGLIISAILFSTTGVFIALLITQQPFGIVMSGIGVISLAGIVVNNNIVLIDTYNHLRKQGFPLEEAIIRTGAQRLRPVMLTTVTTILGLMPMVLQLNIDLFERTVYYGAPSTQWWVQLATAVAGGLTFATLLTLVVTPCMLMLGGKMERFWNKRRTNILQNSLHSVSQESQEVEKAA
jgi:multidrug efflux pump